VVTAAAPTLPRTPTSSAAQANTPSQSRIFHDDDAERESKKIDTRTKQFRDDVLTLLPPWQSWTQCNDVGIFIADQYTDHQNEETTRAGKALFVLWSKGGLTRPGSNVEQVRLDNEDRATAEGKYIDPAECAHDLEGAARSNGCSACYFEELMSENFGSSDSLILKYLYGNQKLSIAKVLKNLRQFEFTETYIQEAASGRNPDSIGCRFLKLGKEKFKEAISAEGLGQIVAKQNPSIKVVPASDKSEKSVHFFTAAVRQGEESGYFDIDATGVTKLKRADERNIFSLLGDCKERSSKRLMLRRTDGTAFWAPEGEDSCGI